MVYWAGLDVDRLDVLCMTNRHVDRGQRIWESATSEEIR